MSELACPHLGRETVAYRESLDLSRPAQVNVTMAWYCGHPFHGIRLDLGDALADVERHCAACTLPMRQPKISQREPQTGRGRGPSRR